MAVFTSSVFALRRKMIIRALIKAGAADPTSAKALSETDLENPESFPEFTGRLVDLKVIHRTPDGKYYVQGGQGI